MKKNNIIELLTKEHNDLFSWLDKNAAEFWEYGPSGKWNTGQQILHLIQSEKPLNRALSIPKFFLKYKFGVANRPSRTYQETVAKYLLKIKENEGVVSPFSSKMKIPPTAQRNILIKQLHKEHQKMITTIQKKWSEAELDRYIVPHPLMGRVTMREITAWTAYHTQHHTTQIVERALAT